MTQDNLPLESKPELNQTEYFGLHPRLAKKFGAWVLAISLASTVNGYRDQYSGDSDTVFFQSPLCAPYQPETEFPDRTDSGDENDKEIKLVTKLNQWAKKPESGSSAGKFESRPRLNLVERVNQLFDFIENEQYEFTMEKSGVSVSIYSNGESPLTPSEFTRLYEFGLEHHDDYPVAEMRYQMECYKKLLFEEKVAADVPIWVFIADKNQPNTCLSWGMMVNFESEEERQAICDHHGISFPIRLKILDETIFEAYAIIITPNTASTDPEVISKRLEEVTLHEASAIGHLGDYQTSTPTPLDMNEASVDLRTNYTKKLLNDAKS